MKKIVFIVLLIQLAVQLFAQDQCVPVGFATQNGGVTGGGTATPRVVTNYADLRTALTTATVKVVHIQGVITFPANGRINLQDQTGKTIFGLPGARLISVDRTASGSGILYVRRCNNIIFRNIIFEGTGAYDTDGNDNMTIDQCQNIWIDHCDFQDGTDGNLDFKNQSDYISVTWTKFSYLKPPIAGGSGGADDHRYSNLIGSSDNATADEGKLRITFQHCWWAQGCKERMPRVRFGKIHIVNNLFNSSVANHCVRAGFKADLLIESNVFENVRNPIDLFDNNFTAITTRNNLFTNTTGNTAGRGTSFVPTYSLVISPVANVKSQITNTSCGAGATLDGPTQCGCGTPPPNQSPTATLTTSATSVCSGSTVTLTSTATDTDGSIARVDFYNGTTLIGTDNTSPYTLSYTATSSGTLSLRSTAVDNLGATGNSNSTTVTVNALPTATITAGGATTFCQGGSVVLSATTGTGLTYQWRNGTTTISGATAATYTATASGTYSVLVRNASNCSATSTATTVTVNALPTATITAGGATTFCQGGSVVLSATTGTGLTYQWRNGTTTISGATAATYTATASGTYSVLV
nr:Ig-like domain-containing protein [Cytophagaceae bacterium]